MTSLTDAFKLLGVEVNQNNNKVIIQDSTVEVNIVIESCFPKPILCVQVAVSLEATKDGKIKNDLPNPRPQELAGEGRQNSSGKKQQSVHSQQNDSGDTQRLR
jgi:hypothetical protein